MTAVAVHHLYKSYGSVTAVKDLSFSVEPGEILGLIGPNGAGKSSTIKMVLDFMKPDSGEIDIFGHEMDEATKNRIGYLPEEKGLYKKLPALDQIIYLASLKGMDRASASERAHELLQRTGMLESKKKKIKEMSKGMGQMIQLIVTIVHDPELILLDEPFSGLDPVNTELVRDVVGELRDQGKAIILSTHQMNQVEELCDRVLMINHGSAVLYDGMQEIRTRFRLIQVLFSSVSIRQLLIGKVLALGTAGLLQVLVWLISTPLLLGLASSSIGGFMARIQIPVNFLLLGIVYFVLGYLLFAVLSIGIGAISSSAREGTNLSLFYTLGSFVPLWFSSLNMFFPNSFIWVVLTIFPVTAPIMAMFRLGTSGVPLWQIITSIGVLALSIVVGLFLSIKIFRMHMLMVGKRPSLAQLVQSLRDA